MRLILSAAALLCALPALAVAGPASDLNRVFPRDPGTREANACFVKRYSSAYLAAHPKQNVRDILAYVFKSEGEDPNYGMNAEIHFKTLAKPFQTYSSCLTDDGNPATIYCHIDCDGGRIALTVKGPTSISIGALDHARFVDPLDNDPTVELPTGASFGEDDKDYELERVSLKDCLPLIYDEDMKVRVSQGLMTQ